MTRSIRLAAAAATAAALAAPAAAVADTVVAGPLKLKGYDVTLTATDGGATDALAVSASKRSGASTQTHLWSLEGAAVTVRGAKATIKGSFGAFGRIDAKLTAGRRSSGKVPAGCTGTAGSARAGKLTGRIGFVLDSGFFGTVRPKALTAQLLTGGKLECGRTAAQPTSGLVFSATLPGDAGMTTFSAARSGASVDQTVLVMDPPAGAVTGMHIISAKTGAAGLSAADDLSTATIQGAAPFLSGTVQFAGEGMGTMAAGTTSGDLAAKFDSIGTKTIPSGTDAVLQQR